MEALLREYNPHWQGPFQYDLIAREDYRLQLMPLIERKEIVVMKGIRRSGKSSLMRLAINALLQKGVKATDILFINLEDYRLGSEKSVDTLDEIYQSYFQLHKPAGRFYVLMDEIQEITDFERWLRTHYDHNEAVKFIVTGSSSSLFSNELATLLTGRQISLEVFPFSFSETLQHRQKTLHKGAVKKAIDTLFLSKGSDKIEACLADYLRFGGFPEVVKNQDAGSNALLLQQYISDIILRDVARRHNVRKIQMLQDLAIFLLHNVANPLNISRLAEILGSNRNTVLDLIAYLEEVYLIFLGGSFSFSLEERLSSTRARKVFCIDNGFFSAVHQGGDKADYQRVCNAVFQQLRFAWQEEVFYWKNKVEIDFVLKDGLAIGVSQSDHLEVQEREIFRMFHYLHTHNQPLGLMISKNRLQIHEENQRRVMVMPLWIFLLKSREEILTYEA